MQTKKDIAKLDKNFLIKRGSCCGLGCMECPYEPKAKKGNTVLSLKSIKSLKEYDKKTPQDEYLGAKFKPSYRPDEKHNDACFYFECTYYNKDKPIDNVYTIRFIK